MSGHDEFVAQMIEKHCSATTAVRNGDPTLFVQLLSTNDPVTLFPASQPSRTGWADVSQAIRRVASVYSSSEAVEFEVVAAGLSGDLACIVGHERLRPQSKAALKRILGSESHTSTGVRTATGS
jgi:ketosteroid isomerase-like protein